MIRFTIDFPQNMDVDERFLDFAENCARFLRSREIGFESVVWEMDAQGLDDLRCGLRELLAHHHYGPVDHRISSGPGPTGLYSQFVGIPISEPDPRLRELARECAVLKEHLKNLKQELDELKSADTSA